MTPLTKHITTIIKAFKAIALVAMLSVLPALGYGSVDLSTNNLLAVTTDNNSNCSAAFKSSTTNSVTYTMNFPNTYSVTGGISFLLYNGSAWIHPTVSLPGTLSNCTGISMSTSQVTGGYTAGFNSSPYNTTQNSIIRVTNATGAAVAAFDITVTYDGVSTVTVTGAACATISSTGTLSAVNTTSGTASSATTFSVSGTSMSAGILVTPPAGFEVSTDGSTYSSTVTVGSSGTISATTVYARLAAATAIGSYSGNIVLSSSGATSVNVATVSSTVSATCTFINSGANITIAASTAINGVNLTNASSGVITNSGTLTFSGNCTNSATFSNLCGALVTISGSTNNSSGTMTGATVAGTYSRIVNASTVTNTGGTIGASTTLAFSGAITSDGTIGTSVLQSSSQVSTCVAIPVITISTATLSGFTYGLAFGPSQELSYTVSGSNLTNDITITVPTDYIISTTSGSESASTITLTKSGGTVSVTTIYVKLKSGLSIASYNAENIVNASIGATTQNVSCSGDVTAVPTVTLGSNTVSAGNVIAGTIDNIVNSFTLTTTNANATINTIVFTANSGNAVYTTDITNYKLYYTGSSSTFSTGTCLGTITSGVTFSSLTQSLPIGGPYYFWITADIVSNANSTRTISLNAVANAGITYSSGSVTKAGSASAGGTQIIVYPTIVISSANPAVAAANIGQNTTNNVVSSIQMTVTNATATVNSIVFANTGNAVYTTDVTNYKLYYTGTTSSFASTTCLGTITSGTTFSSLTQSLPVGGPYYFWITADLPTTATTARNIIISAIPNASITFASSSKSGTTSASGTQTIVATAPSVTLGDNTQVSGGTVMFNTTNNIVSRFQLSVSSANTATLNTVAFSTSGNAVTTTDLTNFKLWYASSNSFGSASTISTLTTNLSAANSPHTFSSLTQTIAYSTTGYFWITADIPAGATNARTVAVSAMANIDITLASGSVSGSATAAGTQTISTSTSIYSIGGGGNWSDNTKWSLTAGGGACTCHPIAGYTAIITSGNNITVDAISACDNVVVNSSATLSGSTFALTVSGNVTNSGTYTASSGNTNIGGNFTSTGTFNNNNGTIVLNGTIPQSISVSGNLYNLTNSNTTSTCTAGSSLTVNQTFTTSASSVLDMSTYQLLGSLNTLSNSGTITTSCTSNPAIPNSKSWGGTINFSKTNGGQYIPSSSTFTNVTFSNTSGTNTAQGNITYTGTGTFTSTAGGTLAMGNNTFSVYNFTNAGTITTSSTIAIANTVSNTGSIVTSSQNNPPIPASKTWGGTIEFSNTGGGQNIVAGTYNNLLLDNTSNTNTAQGAIVVNGALTTASGGTFDLTSNYTLSGTLTSITNNGIIKTSVITSTSATPLPTGKTWGGTVQYTGGNAQTMMAGNYNNLTLNNSSGASTSGAVNVSGTLALSNGKITTTSSNILTVTNTSTSAISGASTSNYINGPFALTLAANLSSSASSYSFPVGKGGTYFPFSITTLTTGATAPIITVEAFNADCGGSGNGTTVGSLSTSEYWSASVTSGNFTTASVSIGRQSNALSAIGRCATVNGSYASLGGTVSSYNINNSSLTSSSLGFFAMCKLPYFAIASGNFATAGTWSNTDGGSAASSSPSTGDVVTIGHGYTVTINNTISIGTLTVTGSSSTLTFNSGAWGITFTVTGNTYIDEGGTISGVNNQNYYYVFNNLLVGSNTVTSNTSSFSFTPSDNNSCGVTISGMLSVGSCAGIGVSSPVFNYSPTFTGGTNPLIIANRTIYPNGTYTFGCTGGTCPSAPSTTTSVTCPLITVSSFTLSGLSYILGSGPSTVKTFTVSGSNLVSDIVITPPTDYQISSDNSTWTNPSITLTQSGGTVGSTTMYVRLKSGLSKASYSESVSLTSTNATTRNITCSGSVNSAISAVNTMLTPTSTSLTADGTSTQILTVQPKDADGNNALITGLTVTITKSSGTGTISSVTDNGNGTYTATVTAPTSTGSGVFVATIGGSAVQSGGGSQTQATVTYIAGAPSQIIQNTADNQSGFLGCTVTTQPSVTVADAHGNPVSGVTVIFSVGSGGGSITGATQTTDVNGKATVGSWTLGTSGANSLYATATAATSTAAIQYPFPQSIHFKYPYGISASNPDYTRLQSLITTWISHYYREGNLPNGTPAARVQWDDSTLTVSEGMGYGMVILVYTENATNQYQAKFNKLWQYYNYFKDGNGLMNWRTSGFSSVTGPNGATDADLDVALAMIMAHKQWGSNSPDANGVTINYLARAQEMFHAIYLNEVDGNHLLKPGDSWNSVQNPSYAELFAIKLAADEQTAGVLTTTDAWSTVYTSMQAYITHYANATTGLLPNWTDPNATGSCNSAGYNANDDKCGGAYDKGCLYGIDALRVPWRIAWDYSWYGTASSKATSDLTASWLTGTANNGPGNNPRNVTKNGASFDMYNTDGSFNTSCSNVAGTVNGMGYIGGLTHTFMTGTNQSSLDSWYEYIQDTTLAYTTTTNPNWNGGGNGAVQYFTDYYNHTLQILYLLTVSGNTPNYFSTNPVISGSPLTITATAVTTVYSENSTDLSNTSHWWTGTNATGGHPCNFTTSGTSFIVQSGHSCSFNSNTAFSSGVSVQVLGTITPTSSVVVSGAGTLNGSGTVVVTRTTSSEDNFDNQYSISNRTISGLTVQYAGSTDQAISNAHAFNNLTINNTTVVNQSVDQTVSGNLTMTSGLLSTGTSIVDLGATGSILESTPNAFAPTSFVVGKVQATRNIGSSVNQTFGGIGMEINETNAANSTVVLRTTGTACVATGHHSITRYFTITPNVDAGLNGTMVFHYFDHELAGHIEANLQIWKSIDNRVTWSGQNSSVFVGTNTLTLGSIASFSDWTATDPVSNPLPISLLDFSAKQKNDAVDLFWKTASEVNNDYFVLERSIDGVNWEEIYTCKGAGTSTIINHYSFVDYEIQSSTVYYKLKQIDFDGKCSYSNILSVTNNIQPSRISVYPNPFDGRNIYITGLCDKEFAINIYDILGKSVYTTNIKLDGEVVVILDLDKQLPVGSYIIKLQSADQVFIQHLMVGKRD
jgi:hypothetical protein